jgi:ATP-dependent DNA helicase RecG
MELTGVELNEFLLKKAGKTWDDVVEEGATMKNIDESSVRKFIEDSKEKVRLPNTKGLTVFQFLEKLQLTEGKKLKRAALCLFAKYPGKFYPNVEVRIGRFGKDATDLRFQEGVEGNLVQLLDEVQVQLNNKFLVRPVSFEGMHRIEKDTYPVSALREMLLNALVHRTYMGAHIQLRVFDDRLSIWNEGMLPNGLTLDDLKSEHNSRPRNPKIAKACFIAGYIDTWGRGTLKIIEACKEAGLAEPLIEETNGGIAVTLFNRGFGKPSEDLRNKFRTNSEQIIKRFGSIAERIHSDPLQNIVFFQNNHNQIINHLEAAYGITSEKLRKSFGLTSEKKIPKPVNVLVLISMFSEITADQIGKILGVSERSSETYIKKLKSEGFIERIGGRKEGAWQIIALK